MQRLESELLGRITLIATLLLVAGCNSDTPTGTADNGTTPVVGPSFTWVSPQPCQIASPSPPDPPTYTTPYFGTIVPTPGATCGVGWHLFIPYANYYGGYFGPSYAIGWTKEADTPPLGLATYFMAGGSYWDYGDEGNETQKGPLEITFDKAVKNVSLVLTKDHSALTGPLLPGHYMVALDSAGQQIGRVDFDAGIELSEKTLAVSRIRKVVVYPVVIGHNDFWDIDNVETVHHRVSFAVDTIPVGKLRCLSAAGDSLVTRGQTVTCTVTGTGVVVTGWTFTGPSYDNPNQILRVTGPTSGNTWPSGPAITSGDVAATINVNGVPRSTPLTTSFIVKPRTGNTWTWGPNLHWKYTQATGKNCGSGTMEYSEGTIMGWNRRTGGCTLGMLTPDPFASLTNGYTVKGAMTGPNSGLWYVSALTYQMLRESQINQALLPNSGLTHTLIDTAEKTLCSAKARKAITKANFYFFNATCKTLDVAGLIAGIWRHEGYGTTNGSGHQAQFEMTASLPEYSLYNNEEAVFAITQADARTTVVALARSIDDGIRQFGGSEGPVDGNNWTGNLYKWFSYALKFVEWLVYT